ncbi:MAG: outer membrane beta-barrel protein [Betaproteobacteria bacterium]
MKLEKLKQVVLACVAFMLFSMAGTAVAQGYIGLGAGLTAVDICDEITALGATTCDDEDVGLKLFGGYKFNPNFAVEAAWVDLGEISASDGFVYVTEEVDGFQFAAVGIIPINPQFAILGKLGAYIWDVSATASAPGLGSATASDDGTDIMFGAGALWNLSQQFGLRAEWERFDIDGDDVDFLSIGVQLSF